MDWQELQETILVPQQVSARAQRLLRLSAVRDGTMYDALPYPFSKEWNNDEYIPLSQRRPSVRSHLCTVVVEDAASLTFGETHWPTLKCDSPDTAEALSSITRECQLPAVLMEAILKGSIGSVALLVEAVDGALSVSVLDTPYLEPEWDAKGDLVQVVSQYLIKGRQVRALGYAIPAGSDAVDYWYRREWTRTESRVYKPWLATSDADPEVDTERSGPPHGLGFVPIVWARNLAPPGQEPDGPCTFERAIDTVIEGDYQLSQVGRGLKYCSDPKLVITGVGGDPAGGDGAPASEGGSATAIVLPEKASAKMLEINGSSAGTVMEYWRELRALVLEILHGNRAHADKISAAQSGRAMEMMCQSLVWLADRMRLSYGEGALLSLYRMICDFSLAIEGGIQVDGERVTLDDAGLALEWPPYFPATDGEILQLSQALVTAVKGGILSNESACSIFAAKTGCADPATEWARVQAELQDPTIQATRNADASATKAVRTAAGVGKTETHQVTA